ncbi:MAG: GNAT family N-acetyltransferase [Pseudomonadota bacterium]
MTLRPALPSDAASIAAISIEVWIGTYLKRGVSAFFAEFALDAFTADKTRALIADPRNHVLVSENDEGIDGFMRIASDSPAPVAGCSDVEIATFYVQPRHHGTGIGGKLLSEGVEHCRARGAGSVWLQTNAENDPAIAFYLKRGFEQVGETHFRIADQAYLNNVYRLTLS